MYDVCIVDDEVLIRQSITARIKESGMPLRVLGCTSNAESALMLYWSAKPDIFFIDINMPRMDGLSLIRKIREEDPGCTAKFIIITGYDDFAHMREAIQSGVMDYLKKPITTEEFSGVLNEAVTQIRQERRNSYITPKDGSVFYEEYIAKGARLFTGGLALVLYASSGNVFDKEESIITLKEALFKLTDAGEKWFSLRFRNAGNIVFCYYPGKTIHKKNLTLALKRLLEKERLSAVYAYPGIEQIEVLVERLERCLNTRFLKSEIGSPFFVEAFPRSSQFSADTGLLDYALERGSIKDTANTIESMLSKTAGNIQTIGELCPLYRQIVLLLINKCIDYIIPMPPSFKEELSPFALCKFSSLHALLTFLVGTASSIAGTIGSEYQKGELIKEVAEYLKQHYRNNISLQSLSKEFFITPPYLSRRFKEKTGFTFVEYLEEVRLEKAEEYLLTSDVKIVDISEQVGYPDPNYFAKVFKKKYGISPSDYRAANRNDPS